MTSELNEFQARLRVLLGLRSMELTDEELARMADRYRMCTGKERWDVRQYAGRTGIGTREFRVMRGTSIEDVYRSTQRVQADAVGAALNALEAEDKP
jgi:hypothetical protein